MVSQLGKSFEDATEDLSQRTERVAREVEAVASRAAENLGETTENLRQAANDGFDRFEVAVRRSPLASAAIAAGIGFFCAALARR